MNKNYVSIGIIILLIFSLYWIINTQIRENLDNSDPMLERLRELLIPVHEKFRTIPLYDGGNKSFTINKKRIHLSMRKKDGSYYNLSILSYCLIHEMAHVLNTKDVGHTEEFYRINNELLSKAQALGIYNPSIPLPEDYSK